MLKHCLLALLLAGLVYYGVTPSVAQDNGSNQQSAPAGAPSRDRGPGHFSPEKRTEMLTRHLHLTSDQQSRVLEILKSAQSQMESLRSDASVPQADRHSKMMEIHKASDDQIRALLDSNQQTKWDAMQSRREQEHHQHGQAQQN